MDDRDTLTGLLNGRNLLERIQAAINEARAVARPLTLAEVDLDGLHDINRVHGWQVGDRVLKTFAEIASRFAEPTHQIVRFGHGNIFLVMPNTQAQSAWNTLEEIRKAFAATAFPATDGTTFTATLTAGITQLQPAMPDAEDLMRQSHRATYDAKRAGRNHVRIGGIPVRTNRVVAVPD